MSLFIKLIHVLPIHEWLLLYNWYNKLTVVVKWNGSYSKSFCVTRGTRQGSVLSPYLFNIFINHLLLDLYNYDAGVRIGDTMYIIWFMPTILPYSQQMFKIYRT